MKENFVEYVVYTLLNLIPIGKVTTYGSLAKVLNVHPRVIGRILAKNRELVKIPCHRVVKSNGELGGYSGGSVKFKAKLLMLEGVKVYERNGKYYVDKECILDVFSKLFSAKNLR